MCALSAAKPASEAEADWQIWFSRRANPGAPIGNRNARKHGGYSAKAMAAARYLKMIARLVRGVDC